MSLFLFVLVKEALTDLMKRAAKLCEFRGFKINEVEEVNLVHFGDDKNLFVDKTTIIWSWVW